MLLFCKKNVVAQINVLLFIFVGLDNVGCSKKYYKVSELNKLQYANFTELERMFHFKKKCFLYFVTLPLASKGPFQFSHKDVLYSLFDLYEYNRSTIFFLFQEKASPYLVR